MRIELHIDRVVIDRSVGAPSEVGVVRRAIEDELARLLSADARMASASSAHVARASAPPIQPRGPADLGACVARTVVGEIHAATRSR